PHRPERAPLMHSLPQTEQPPQDVLVKRWTDLPNCSRFVDAHDKSIASSGKARSQCVRSDRKVTRLSVADDVGISERVRHHSHAIVSLQTTQETRVVNRKA